MDTRAMQAHLSALGFNPGPIDGLDGKRTRSALEEAMAAKGVKSLSGLYDSSGLYRIHWHWTAGAEGLIDLEAEHYHFIIMGDGEVRSGNLMPEANGDPIRGEYAAHTLNANTGAIGIAIDAMAGAQERPFKWGSNPITEAQIESLCRLTAKLCKRYAIPVSRFSTLSHSEVQPTLGIRQRWKWDINVLPGMTAPGDPIEIGDKLRARVREFMEGGESATEAHEESPKAPPATEDQSRPISDPLAPILGGMADRLDTMADDLRQIIRSR